MGRSLTPSFPLYGATDPSCYYVDLSVFTCYPESNTTLVQDDYSLAIWNSAQPSFISRGRVDVYLYNADTQDVATSWRNESNAQGMIGIVPDDPWWPSGQTAQQWFGASARNRSTPYFFVVVPAGDTLTGGEVHGATFTAIRASSFFALSCALRFVADPALAGSSCRNRRTDIPRLGARRAHDLVPLVALVRLARVDLVHLVPLGRIRIFRIRIGRLRVQLVAQHVSLGTGLAPE